MRASLVFPILFFPAALAGCGAAIQTLPQVLDLPDETSGTGQSARSDVLAETWWEDLDDRMLDDLVERSLEQNITIKIAIARVAQAQASLDAAGIPDLIAGSMSGQASRFGGSRSSTNETSSAGLSSSLFLDLFGARKQGQQQASAQFKAAHLDEGDARLSIISGVTETYLQARYLQQAMKITEETTERRRKVTGLIEEKVKFGAAADLEAAQSRASVREAEKTLVGLQTSYVNTVLALSTLLAEPSEKTLSEMETLRDLPVMDKDEEKIPADLVRNRPDVRSAEQALVAAASAVGVAKAQLYPSLTLSGNLSASSGATTWAFGPSISVPVLNRPALKAEVRKSEAAMEQAFLAWKLSILSATQEASAALNTYEGARRSVEAVRNILSTQEEVVRISEISQEVGSISMLDLLDERQALDSARLSLLSAENERSKAWTALQIAAGRGWKTP